jgi:hypothetical protein
MPLAAVSAIERALPDATAAAAALLRLQVDSKVPATNALLLPVLWTCSWACSEDIPSEGSVSAAREPDPNERVECAQRPLKQLDAHVRVRCLAAVRILTALWLSQGQQNGSDTLGMCRYVSML